MTNVDLAAFSASNPLFKEGLPIVIADVYVGEWVFAMQDQWMEESR